ncbi:MAG: phosphoribosylformylglycinamidine synthase subunit PurS [bacterium JZ-2024 1]
MPMRRLTGRVAGQRNGRGRKAGRYIARVSVQFKPGVLDPQGQAVLRAAQSLGFKELADVRVGRIFDIVLTAPDERTATDRVTALARDLLANPVIESFTIESLTHL